MKKISFNTIGCKHSTNGPGDDDVLLMVQVDGGPPIRYPVEETIGMNDDDKVDFPAGGESDKPSFYYEHVVSLTVWDHDGPANFLNEVDLHVEDNVGDTKTFSHTFDLDEFDGVGETHTEKYEDGGTEFHVTALLLVKSQTIGRSAAVFCP